MLAMAAQKPELIPVQSREVDFYFHQIWPLLEPAAARNGLYTRESVYAALKLGEFQLWIGECDGEPTMALVSEIAEYPARRQCTIVLAGGRDLDSYMPFLDEIEQWARENGCNRMVVDGRAGWTRKLKAHGYAVRNVVLTKDFYNG